MQKIIILLAVLISGTLFAQKGDLIFDNTYLHDIHVNFYEASHWDTLKHNYSEFSTFSGSDIPYVPAIVSIDGVNLDSVGLRFKGKSSYFYVNDKKPFKFDFNEFISGQTIDGLKKINLQNSLGDPGMMRDLLAYDMMRQIGVRAPRVSFCRLFIDNEYFGVYKIIEQIDKTFLDENFASGEGNLYKNQRWSNLNWWGDDPNLYKDTFELKTNETEDDWSGFINFLDVLNNTPENEFAEAISEVFNVDQYLKVLAIDIMTNNWDSYIDNRRNWYLYHEPESNKFHWIPWDYNLSWGGRIILQGNPYPPYDPECPVKSDFFFAIDESDVHFFPKSDQSATGWLWEFGDGSMSTEENPVHTYTSENIINKVCLTTFREESNQTCAQKRCKIIPMDNAASACLTLQTGDAPYEPSDPAFQGVINEDDYCCNTDWDVFCSIKYQDVQNQMNDPIETFTDYTTDYELLLDNPEKILIDRLLAVPEFKDRYLDICCTIRENQFNETILYSRIDFMAGLIRNAIHEDSMYQYTSDYFEYDVGNGTGGGEEAYIPSLKYFINQRINQIDAHLADAQQNCEDAQSPLVWHDVVINEVMASNGDNSGITDPSGENEDWIELYNNTNTQVNLYGFYLSDDLNVIKHWPFPQGTVIEPFSYLIVWADKDLSQPGLHCDFKLSAAGEHLILSHEDGTWIDQINFQPLDENETAARRPNGSGTLTIQPPTFNSNNDLVTNLEDQSRNTLSLTIHPNPVKNDLTLVLEGETGGQQPVEISLYHTTGSLLYSNKFPPGNTWTIPLKKEGITSGIYLVKFQKQQFTTTKKILIQ